jgi:hypothetical protein
MRRISHRVSHAAALSSLVCAALLALCLVACTDCEHLNALSYTADYDGGIFDGGAPLPVDGGLPSEVWLDEETCKEACDSATEHCSLLYTEWPDTDASTLVFRCYEPVCY